MAQVGSALRSGRRGRRFKSCYPDHQPAASLRAFSLLTQHPSEERYGDQDGGENPRNRESQFEVLAHLPLCQPQRQP